MPPNSLLFHKYAKFWLHSIFVSSTKQHPGMFLVQVKIQLCSLSEWRIKLEFLQVSDTSLKKTFKGLSPLGEKTVSGRFGISAGPHQISRTPPNFPILRKNISSSHWGDPFLRFLFRIYPYLIYIYVYIYISIYIYLYEFQINEK